MIRLLSLLFLFSPVLLHAAAQTPDKLRIDGKELPLMATPLETFWSQDHPRPTELTQTTWACWRGYVGTWEIAENTLYLVRIERLEVTPKNNTVHEHLFYVPLADLFGTNRPVPATWFSGVLRAARGRILTSVNTGFASVYEEDLFLTIKEGKIIERRSIKNDLSSLTSECDLAWRELGRINHNGGITAVLPEDNAALEKGEWLSQTDLATRAKELVKNKASFEVRGVFFPGRLWFPRLTGQEATYPLDVLGTQSLPSPGVAVTATCMLLETEIGPRLVATTISELPPGSAIQRHMPSQRNPHESTKLAADSNGPAGNP